MPVTDLIPVATLCLSLVSAGGGSYAALISGRVQRRIAEQQRVWQEAQAEAARSRDRVDADRVRSLEQLRLAYEAEIRNATHVEQYLWMGVHQKEAGKSLGKNFQVDLGKLVREHAMTHSVVDLLGSAEVINEASIMGREMTMALRPVDRASVSALQDKRVDMLRAMRRDLELAEAALVRADDLYDGRSIHG